MLKNELNQVPVEEELTKAIDYLRAALPDWTDEQIINALNNLPVEWKEGGEQIMRSTDPAQFYRERITELIAMIKQEKTLERIYRYTCRRWTFDDDPEYAQRAEQIKKKGVAKNAKTQG